MPTLPNGTQFDWHKEGYEDGSDEGGPFVIAQAVVAWPVRFDFVNGVRSTVTITPGTPTTAGVTWNHPWQYPDSPNLYCMDCRLLRTAGTPREASSGGFQVVGPDGTSATAMATYGLTFRIPPFDILGIDTLNSFNQTGPLPFMSMRRETGTEIEKVPGWTINFITPISEDETTPDKDFNLHMPTTRLVFTRHQLPYMPSIVMDDFVGCVNAAPFYGYDIGQVRYDGITSSREVDWGGGNTVQEIEVTFTRKPYDHNTMWSPVRGRGRRRVGSPVGDGTFLFLHPYVDFDTIFQQV
jgi:hypothetical protein